MKGARRPSALHDKGWEKSDNRLFVGTISLKKIFFAVAALAAAAALGYGFFAGRGVQRAPLLVFTTIKGELLTPNELRGKVVLVNFWATDCVACIKEMPGIVATHVKYRSLGLETVAVAMSYDPPNHVLNYAEKNKLPFHVALDIQGEAARLYGNIEFTPTTFVIDKRGKIVKRYLGEPDFAQLQALIEAKLLEPS
jgi:peroxiredoxin